MSEREPRLPLDVLRAAVSEAMGTRSLREAAAQIGISHTGLRGFLNGAKPHRHTRRKLEAWLVDAEGGKVGEPGAEYTPAAGRDTYLLGRAAVRALARTIDSDRTSSAVEAYDGIVRRLFREAGRTPPSWLGAGDGR